MIDVFLSETHNHINTLKAMYGLPTQAYYKHL